MVKCLKKYIILNCFIYTLQQDVFQGTIHIGSHSLHVNIWDCDLLQVYLSQPKKPSGGPQRLSFILGC